jgi:menaquinone-dependent protoporphyrinogen oxidase
MTTPSTSPRVLVVTDSRHGATHEIGGIISTVLVDAGLWVDHREAREVETLVGYDAVILGSAVYVGRWMPDLRTLIEQNAQSLALVPVWLFESGPLGDPPAPAGRSDDLAAFERQLSASGRVFPGRLNKASLGRGERILTRLVHAPDGDFRPIDEIKAWATAVSELVLAEAPRASLCDRPAFERTVAKK